MSLLGVGFLNSDLSYMLLSIIHHQWVGRYFFDVCDVAYFQLLYALIYSFYFLLG